MQHWVVKNTNPIQLRSPGVADHFKTSFKAKLQQAIDNENLLAFKGKNRCERRLIGGKPLTNCTKILANQKRISTAERIRTGKLVNRPIRAFMSKSRSAGIIPFTE
ncbi:MAG: hypothetical protein CL859_11665 [Cyanobium sp. ARS6]|nr:hypothetical protein [Cyanobium sp. ARS6]